MASGEATVGDSDVATGSRGRFQLQVGQLPLQYQLLIAIVVHRLERRLNLHLDVLQRLEIGVQLRRQATGELHAIGLEFLLLFNQPAAGIAELDLQKLVGSLSQHRSIAQAFFDEQRSNARLSLAERFEGSDLRRSP